MEKKCNKCLKMKETSEFNTKKYKSGNIGLRSNCKQCDWASNKIYAFRNRVSNEMRIKEFLGGKFHCMDCFVEHSYINFFDWHHINPEEKEYNVSSLMSKSWSKVSKELSKCVILCPSCHRKRHL